MLLPISYVVRLVPLGLLGLVLSGLLPGSALADRPEPTWGPDVFGGYASDRIIVRFKPGVMFDELAEDESVPGAAVGHDRIPGAARPLVSQRFHQACDQWNVRSLRCCVRHGFSDPGLASDLGLDRTFVLEVPQGSNAPAMVEAFLKLTGDVEVAGLDGVGSVAGFFPDDPFFDNQWGMHNEGQTGGTSNADVDAPQAWEIHTGNPGTVTIAIIDSGVSLHAEYGDRVIGGINTANPGSTALSDADAPACPHGTHVAGIAAATGNNNLGVAGMTWGANLLRVRALDGCSGTVSPVAEGIIWAVDNGADVINISLQFYNLGQTSLQTFESAIDYAFNSGVLVVAAAGNLHGFDVAHPAEFPNCMAVSATNDNDGLAGISNWGPEINVGAPGDDVYSTWASPANSYNFLDGTSMASPHVAGLAALIKSYLPGITNIELWEIIEDTADDLGDPGVDFQFGHGRINAGAAMAAAEAIPRVISSDPAEGSIDARQPFEPDGSEVDGWSSIGMNFDNAAAGLTVDDFSTSSQPDSVTTPAVQGVFPFGPNFVNVMLDGPIPPNAWTTVQHTITATGVRLGNLPGDIDGSGTSDASDILELVDFFDGVASLADFQADIDRDGSVGPADLLREIDLLNGGGSYDPQFGATLPE